MTNYILLSFVLFFSFSQDTYAQKNSKVICTQEVYINESLSFLKKDSVLKTLSKRSDLIVGHPTMQGFEVYGDDNLFKILDELKISYSTKNFSEKNTLTYKGHPSFDEIESKLKTLNEDFEDIMTLESIGKSIEGRDIWLMRIEEKTEKNRSDKKHIFYIANMHGDEITGRELMVMLIEDLGDRYKNNDVEILNLLDQRVIHILPSMNPDGAERRRRTNAKRVDLNRDFPDWTRGNENSLEGREPEVQAVMKYFNKYDFIFSANFHGGAQVVNYPWDNSPEEGDLERVLKQISFDYIANGADYMKSSFFPSGVTRGYDWYPVYGGLQDWSTHYHDSPHITIELSDTKWPHFDDMSYFYENNKNSLIKAMGSLSPAR